MRRYKKPRFRVFIEIRSGLGQYCMQWIKSLYLKRERTPK